MVSVTIIGAGGIGCAVGYALLEAGVPVTFIDANRKKIDFGRAYAVQVARHAPRQASFVHFDDWAPAPADNVLLCTKCYDNERVLARLHASAQLIPIQNGFDPALDQRKAALEGIASFVSECRPDTTHTRITRRGKLHLGSRGDQSPSKCPELSAALRSSKLFRVVEVVDILPYKYTKLMYNAAISPVAAAAGLDNGQLLAIPRARRLFFDLLRENYEILRGAGIPLAKIGPFHPDTVQRILSRRYLANSLAWAFYPSLRGTYCSMSGDLPRGQTEIDNYNGHLIALAGTRPCPLNRLIHRLVKRMEQERQSPDREVLEELLQVA